MNVYLPWIGPTIGLVSLTLAITFFILNRRARVGPRLSYLQRSTSLLGGDNPALPNEVEIRFRGQKVASLAKTRIVLWNSGTATIRGDAVVQEDPIRFVFPDDGEVLEARIVATARQANKVNVEPQTSKHVACTFDYLDAGDGATIEILYSGKSSSAQVRWTVRGIPTGLRDQGRLGDPALERGWFRKALVIFCLAAISTELWELFAPLSLHNLLLWKPPWSPPFPSISSKIVEWSDHIGRSFAAIAIAWMWWMTRRRYPKNLQ